MSETRSATIDGFHEGAPPTVVDAAARKALLGSALGYAMDGFDLLILGFMLRVISADLGLTPAQGRLAGDGHPGRRGRSAAWGSACCPTGMGRVRVLTWTIVLFAVFTGLCALAQRLLGPARCYRTLAGASGWVASSASAWRWWRKPGRPSKRARASSYVGLGWQLGVLAAAHAHPLAAAGDRLARHVLRSACSPPSRHTSFAIRLHEPEVFVQRTTAPQAEIVGIGALAGGRCRGRRAKLSIGHGDPLLRAELRLLRRHDLAAELSRRARFGFGSHAVRHLDRPSPSLGMAVGIYCLRPGRRSRGPSSPAFIGWMVGVRRSWWWSTRS